MHRSNRRLFERFQARPPDRMRHAHRPVVEGLEERSLLSAVHPVHTLRIHSHQNAQVSRPHPGPGHAHPPSNSYQQINLVSDFPAGVEGVNAQVQDAKLLNPWGMAASATSPFWVSDQVSGVSTLYSVSSGPTATKVPLTVTIPSAVTQPAQGFNPLTGPTGIVFNGDPNTGDFLLADGKPATFIFSTLDGTIAAWNRDSGTTAQIVVPHSAVPTEEFTGLALGQVGSAYFLYTADPRSPTGIDVFNASFQPVVLQGVPQMGTGSGFGSFGTSSFFDPKLPGGFSPYNIQDINGDLFVTYVTPASGGGYVAEFDTSGNFLRQLSGNGSRGPLQSPWGLALAPADFGRFSNDLLVGNFGDGRINAYNFQTGRFEGQLANSQGDPIVIPFLWALDFGNGQASGPANTLFFTAGIAGQFHGLFGALQAAPRAG